MRLAIYPRSYPLQPPFRTAGWTLKKRNVILIRLEDSSDAVFGWGEAAPLTHFGTEDYAAAMRALEQARDVIALWKPDGEEAALIRDGDVPALIAVLTGHATDLSAAPTARFALETAMLDLVARRRGIGLARLLGSALHDSVPVNAVIGGVSLDATVEAASAAVRHGYSCLKMKIGAESVEQDIDRVRAVREAVPPGTLFRLDVNGAWDFSTAEDAMHSLKPYGIEYIEQPVPAEDVDELAALKGLGIIPVAADEAVQDLTRARELLAMDAADFYILKPMAVGSLLDARGFAVEAYKRNAVAVFTSLIDSAVARHAVAQLCASLPASPRHHGLGTGMLFERDSARDRIAYGRFHLPAEAGLGVIPNIDPEE